MSKVLTASEVRKHDNRKSVWIVIKNDVYDVTAFLNEHPGGDEPLLDAAGMDATRAFEDIGHSADARKMLKKYKIGSLAKGESCSKYHRQCTECPEKRSTPKSSITSLHRSRSSSPTKKCHGSSSPRVIPRVNSIIVPRRPPRRPRGPPCAESGRSAKRAPPPSSSKLKWALLALAAAIVIGVAYKKYAS